MHFVGLGFEPGEEALGAVPDALVPISLALDHPFAALDAELAPGCVNRDTALLGILDEIVLALLVGLGLPGFDGAAAQGFAFVGNDQAVVDADGSPEAAA